MSTFQWCAASQLNAASPRLLFFTPVIADLTALSVDWRTKINIDVAVSMNLQPSATLTHTEHQEDNNSLDNNNTNILFSLPLWEKKQL